VWLQQYNALFEVACRRTGTKTYGNDLLDSGKVTLGTVMVGPIPLTFKARLSLRAEVTAKMKVTGNAKFG
jgi:hypothetical protein